MRRAARRALREIQLGLALHAFDTGNEAAMWYALLKWAQLQ